MCEFVYDCVCICVDTCCVDVQRVYVCKPGCMYICTRHRFPLGFGDLPRDTFGYGVIPSDK